MTQEVASVLENFDHDKTLFDSRQLKMVTNQSLAQVSGLENIYKMKIKNSSYYINLKRLCGL